MIRRCAATVALSLLVAVPIGQAHEAHRTGLPAVEMPSLRSFREADPHRCQKNCLDDAVMEKTGHEGHGRSVDPQEIVPADSDLEEQMTWEAASERNRATSFGDLLGRIHPMAVHFPIALLLMAAFFEIALMIRPTLGLESTVRLLLGAGAVGAAVATFFGWFAAGWRLLDRSETLALHRWIGTGVPLIGLLGCWFSMRPRSGRTGLRVVLAIVVLAVVAQGYLGGEIVFGPNHLGIF